MNYSSLDMMSEVSGKINAAEKGTSPRIDAVSAKISFIPLTSDYQTSETTSITTNPSNAKVTQDGSSITMTWDTIGNEREFSYNIKSKTTTQNKVLKIMRMQKFPISGLEKEYVKFTEPTAFIDINPDITNKTVEIIGGETDLYKAVFRVADWVNHDVQYDLTTLTAEAVQKSSWVYENKRGVCDEITNLFISMLRSVGIPARFIGGQAYSNIGNKFGNHGWAEVYFPGEGWIPFDVTYGQYGWIDPAHLKYKETTDSGDPSADYSWKSRDIEMTFDDLQAQTTILNAYTNQEKDVTMAIEPLKYKVGPGSYVPLQVTLDNPNDYYVPLKIMIRKAPKITEKDTAKQVILAPHESSSIFWIAVIPEDIDPQTVYTTTIEVYSPFAGTADTTIKFAENYEIISKGWAEDTVNSLGKRDEKNYFPNLEWKCGLDKNAYYQEETAALSCDAKNIGNTKLENIKFCIDDNCKTKNIEVNAQEKIEWNLPLADQKTKKLVVTAESDSLIRYSYPLIKIITDPNVKINLLNQQAIAYGSEGKFSFAIASEDYSKNVKITIGRVGEVAVTDLEGSYDVIVNYQGKAFHDGKIRMRVDYEDELGKKYMKKQDFNATITNIPWHVQLLDWANTLITSDTQQ